MLIADRKLESNGVAPYLAVAVAAVLIGGACDRDEPTGQQAPDTRPDGAQSTGDAGALKEKRTAFGLPFPPKVRGVRRLEAGTEVTTRMDLDTLEEFYKTRLVDYEILRPSDQKIRAVGLREFMPAIRGHRYGPITVLYFSPAREKPMADAGAGREQSDDTGIGRPGIGGEGREDDSPEPGTPVEIETDDGEPLAPGAEWGEPYTPPEDSPLHKPRFRENFGKPFGEWQGP